MFKIDRQSEWYTAAFVSTALETVTLPSRLRPYHDFEASLTGDDGIHKIFELQSSISEDGTHTERPRSSEDQDPENDFPKVATQFDLDFSYDTPDSGNAHTFNQIQVARGISAEERHEPTGDDLGLRRRLRLYNSEPIVER